MCSMVTIVTNILSLYSKVAKREILNSSPLKTLVV